jgi:hypothetical protein
MHWMYVISRLSHFPLLKSGGNVGIASRSGRQNQVPIRWSSESVPQGSVCPTWTSSKSIRLHIYIYIYIYVGICIYIDIYIGIYIPIYIDIYIYIYIYIDIYIYIYIYIDLYRYVSIYIYIYIYITWRRSTSIRQCTRGFNKSDQNFPKSVMGSSPACLKLPSNDWRRSSKSFNTFVPVSLPQGRHIFGTSLL